MKQMNKLALSALIAAFAAACGGGSDKPKLIDAQEGDAGMTLECDPLKPEGMTGCAAGQKCGWKILQEMPAVVGTIACVPNGGIAIGQACAYGAAGESGFSDCVAGSECVAGTCKALCNNTDAAAAPACDEQHACSQYNNLFEVADTTYAGICDVKCDPLTQEAVVATPTTTACGSTDPMRPGFGCVSNDFVDFTCARVPMAAQGRVDYEQAYGPSADGNATTTSGAFVNGCEAGFLPMYIAEEGSTSVVCIGTCSPASTSKGMTTKIKGDPAAIGKLWDKAAPAAGDATCALGKKGSAGAPSECWHAWIFNIRMGQIAVSDYMNTVGICFKPSLYKYDSDGDKVKESQFPSCATLPKTPPDATCVCEPMKGCSGMSCPDGLSDEWGCEPIDFTMPVAKGKAIDAPSVKAQMPALGYGEGTVYRHILQ